MKCMRCGVGASKVEARDRFDVNVVVGPHWFPRQTEIERRDAFGFVCRPCFVVISSGGEAPTIIFRAT